MTPPFEIKALWIRREVEHSPIAVAVRRNVGRFYPSATVVAVENADHEEALKKEFSSQSADPVGDGKKVLLVTRFLGRAYKECPGTEGVLCCNLKITNFASGCPFDCSYCYLQGYLNSPVLSVYANTDDIFSEIGGVVEKNPERRFRIGTGELTDSLALDPLTEFAGMAVRAFQKWPHVELELKTKSHFVDGLLAEPGNPRVIVAFSVNPEKIVAEEEHGTSTLNQRLEAAVRVAAHGFSVAFHFDPVIVYPGWEPDYSALTNRISGAVPHSAIRWISVGGLRYNKTLKEAMRERFPLSPLSYGDAVPSTDGKYRYYKPLRASVFSTIQGYLKSHNLDQKMYLCMENTSIWRQALERTPNADSELFGVKTTA